MNELLYKERHPELVSWRNGSVSMPMSFIESDPICANDVSGNVQESLLEGLICGKDS